MLLSHTVQLLGEPLTIGSASVYFAQTAQNADLCVLQPEPLGDYPLQIASYKQSAEHTWDTGLDRESRGLTFEGDTVCCRPLPKFFGLGERPQSQFDCFDWTKVHRVMDKRDGCMATPALLCVNGARTVRWKSKKSFVSDEALRIQLFWETKASKDTKTFVLSMLESGYTPIFEYTNEAHPQVLQYPGESLVLLHCRNMRTGQYVADVLGLVKQLGLNLVVIDQIKSASGFDLKTALASAETKDEKLAVLLKALDSENTEGWVIQFEDGNMVKLKTKWFLRKYLTKGFRREREVAKLVAKEQIDDLKLAVAGDPIALAAIAKVEAVVHQSIAGFYADVERLKQHYTPQLPDFKSIAAQLYAGHHKPLAFAVLLALRGGVPDGQQWFLSGPIQNFSNEVIFSH